MMAGQVWAQEDLAWEDPVWVDLASDPGLGSGCDVGASEIGIYQRLVGKLIYLSHTRLGVAFPVSVVSQFMHSSYEEHVEVVYRIIRYLMVTYGRGLFLEKTKTNDKNVAIFTDADWTGSVMDGMSTLDHCTCEWRNLVTWLLEAWSKLLSLEQWPKEFVKVCRFIEF